MVLVGLGVDPAAERIARFISGGPVDIAVITFHGFACDGERLLARQLAVALRDWAHGGYVLSFKSSDEWDDLRPAVLEFVNAVMENRSTSGEVGT